jgi:muramoyltetrapeptide carboxypeptidase
MIQPVFLKKNDKVAVIATAKNFDKKIIMAAVKQLQSWGLQVLEGKNLYTSYHQFAGTDSQRLEDLQWALDASEIKAVFCARGGYGTARIIDEVNWKKFVKSPKWVIGFSDVTTLHAQIQKNKIQSIHGLMPISFGVKGYELSVKRLQQLLFGKLPKYKMESHPLNRLGKVSANLVGGNLSIICSLIGTDSEIKTKNKVLFLEEVGENLYRVDRMINQLKRTGMLKDLSGLIVGHFTEMEDNQVKFGKSAYEIIAEAVMDYKYPTCYGFPAGHEPENLPLLLGAEVTLTVQKRFATIY